MEASAVTLPAAAPINVNVSLFNAAADCSFSFALVWSDGCGAALLAEKAICPGAKETRAGKLKGFGHISPRNKACFMKDHT